MAMTMARRDSCEGLPTARIYPHARAVGPICTGVCRLDFRLAFVCEVRSSHRPCAVPALYHCDRFGLASGLQDSIAH